MGIFRRLFSSDYRAAVSAEAAGDLELAAERYALAGQRDAAVRVHLARAERAASRAQEIDALRDAMHWAPEEGEWRTRASARLGRALVEQLKAEGVATDRDKGRMRHAASLLMEAGEFGSAAEAYERIEEFAKAAEAYEAGGLVDRMEQALARDALGGDSVRATKEAFADYELAMRGGERDMAREHLARCVEVAENKGEYRRLLDDLSSRLLTGGRIALEVRNGQRLTVASGPTVGLGRDALCDMVLRSRGVSRRHAEVRLKESSPHFMLADCGSRNGTLVGGIPIDGEVPLEESGTFELGEDCEVSFSVSGSELQLSIERGMDKGSFLLATHSRSAISLTRFGIDATLSFERNRPFLENHSELTLNGELLVRARVQLIRGDVISIGGTEAEVLS